MYDFFLNLYFIINPRWWIMNSPYCSKWDKEVNELLDKYKFKVDGTTNLTAKLGGHLFWLGNYPYAYGTLYENNISVSFAIGSIGKGPRPSRKTILRIRKRFKLDMMSKESQRDYKIDEILK